MNNIVFLTGLGFKSSIWPESLLNSNVIRIDLPEIDTPNITEAIEKLAPQIPENSIIIGWSIGGLLALYIHHYFPNKCSKIALIASTPRFMEDQNWPGIKNPQLANNMKDFIRLVNYPNKSVAIRNYLNEHTTDISVHYLEFIKSLDARSIYQNISIPLINILGTQDAIINIKQAKLLAKTYQTEGAGHIPFLTHPEKVSEILKEFINE